MAKDNIKYTLVGGIDIRKDEDRKFLMRFLMYLVGFSFCFLMIYAWVFSTPSDIAVPPSPADAGAVTKDTPKTVSPSAPADAGTPDAAAGGKEGVEGGPGDSAPATEKQAPEGDKKPEPKPETKEEGEPALVCPAEMVDFIPCLDNEEEIKNLPSHKLYEHRERHCPKGKQVKHCLLPLPKDYKTPIQWPDSFDTIWFSNVPKTMLAEYKADQNWLRAEGDKFVFPGGGTQFKHGADPYIDFIEETAPEIAWGKHVRTVLDVGCGVATWGGVLGRRDTLVLSIAPKDGHEAQVQFAEERGLLALSNVLGAHRQTTPSHSFDLAHCSRCRVPWSTNEGLYVWELDRLLRPGGFFVLSETMLYWHDDTSKEEWTNMTRITEGLCWKLVAKAPHEGIAIAVWQKPLNNDCILARKEGTLPPVCTRDSSPPDEAWYTETDRCVHLLPESKVARSSAHGSWPPEWPERLNTAPSWLEGVSDGLFGGRPKDEFTKDSEYWVGIIDFYLSRTAHINWDGVRNVVDMKANYGGFAAALTVKRPVWVLNLVEPGLHFPLSVVFDRGLVGQYHDWCESVNMYPRSVDLLHGDHVFQGVVDGSIKCSMEEVMYEMDRLLRPEKYVIMREPENVMEMVQKVAAKLHWEQKLLQIQNGGAFVIYQKTFWRPTEVLSLD